MRLSVALLVILCACKSRPAAPAAPEARPPAVKTIDLMEQLDKESKQRLGAKPTVEAVIEAFQHASISVDRQKQVVAMSVGALYCAGGFLPSESAIVVCEYASPEAAARGREQALKITPKNARWIFVNRATTLTVTAGSGEGSADALAKKLEEIFSAL